MALTLFAGIYVRERATAQAWYERLLGSEPSFFPNDLEAVWELAEERYLYIEENADHAGHSHQTIIVDDLDTVVSAISARGIEPTDQETYDNGVRKIIYRDPDGNEVGYGGVPPD